MAEWKLLKKTLREVLKIQAERLEDAMVTGRRWTPDEFQTLLVKHPLMVNLVRQLVLAAYDDAGKVTQTFRVTEDQTLADHNDEEIGLPSSGSHRRGASGAPRRGDEIRLGPGARATTRSFRPSRNWAATSAGPIRRTWRRPRSPAIAGRRSRASSCTACWSAASGCATRRPTAAASSSTRSISRPPT